MFIYENYKRLFNVVVEKFCVFVCLTEDCLAWDLESRSQSFHFLDAIQ